mmetsp:Transcript_6567/g.14557  ORF Transcript_6567/g.14557 Transcript_6567/m.14557 type:complete len:296 (-) Transcript_6567:146-1033(-)
MPLGILHDGSAIQFDDRVVGGDGDDGVDLDGGFDGLGLASFVRDDVSAGGEDLSLEGVFVVELVYSDGPSEVEEEFAFESCDVGEGFEVYHGINIIINILSRLLIHKVLLSMNVNQISIRQHQHSVHLVDLVHDPIQHDQRSRAFTLRPARQYLLLVSCVAHFVSRFLPSPIIDNPIGIGGKLERSASVRELQFQKFLGVKLHIVHGPRRDQFRNFPRVTAAVAVRVRIPSRPFHALEKFGVFGVAPRTAVDALVSALVSRALGARVRIFEAVEDAAQISPPRRKIVIVLFEGGR